MFDPEKFITDTIAETKEKINGRAVIAVSGGVDSTVAAVLIGRAIGDRLTAIHVDSGYMRKHSEVMGESEWVIQTLKEAGINCILVNAKEQFENAQLKLSPDFMSAPLKEVLDPEIKRKIIGEQFIRVFEKEAKKVNAQYLIQGTLAPDWIESGGGIRDNIKSHHNVGGLPERMNLKLYEPNRQIYKDEIRKVARALGLPAELAERQPFPGPALAIRIIGAPLSEDNVKVCREANYIWEREIEAAFESGEIKKKPEQYLIGYFPNAKTVGVHGDVRCHGGAIALRAFETIDFMSGQFSKLPLSVIDRASIKITNALKEKVNRIFYDVTNKPPGTTEFE
jgi:GMP synthase (glutamine-hydrolysing)